MRTVFSVTIIESERGWGQRVDEVKEFEDPNEAWKFVEDYNKDNNLDTVPDWYMMALDPVMKRKP